MKSKKKMLLALGAMSAAAIGAGATSTFAWFTTSGAINISQLTGNAYANVAKTATIAALDIEVPVIWGTVNAVELTAGTDISATNSDDVDQTVGGAYVIDVGGHVKLAQNNDTVTKSQLVTFTLDKVIANMKRASGTTATVTDMNQIGASTLTYYVSVYATGHIRLATSRSADSANGYVAAYTEKTYVNVGQINITHTNNDANLTYSYDADSIGTSTSTVSAGSGNFGFYYSISPLDEDGTGDYSGDDSTNKYYGAIYVSIKSGSYDTGVAA